MFFCFIFDKIEAMNDFRTSQNIYVVGLSIHTSRISAREELWHVFNNLPDKEAFCKQMKIEGLVPLATCNRLEWLLLAQDVGFFRSWLQQFVQQQVLYVHENQSAINHLIHVACGLDSAVLGESPIFGQIRYALDVAKKVGWPVKQLEGLMQNSFAQVKKIRFNSGLNEQGYSLIKAIEHAMRQVFSDFSCCRLLIIGAGSMGTMCLERLVDKFRCVRVINRSLGPLMTVKSQFDVEIMQMEELEQSLHWADAIICATASAKPFILHQHLAESSGLKVIVDLSVPRNVDPLISNIDDVFLFDMDAVCGIFEKIQVQRKEVLVHASQLVRQAAIRVYQQWLVASRSKIITDFRNQMVILKKQSLAHILQSVRLGQDLSEVLDVEMERLMNQLLHEPTCFLRKLVQLDDECFSQEQSSVKEYCDEAIN